MCSFLYVSCPIRIYVELLCPPHSSLAMSRGRSREASSPPATSPPLHRSESSQKQTWWSWEPITWGGVRAWCWGHGASGSVCLFVTITYVPLSVAVATADHLAVPLGGHLHVAGCQDGLEGHLPTEAGLPLHRPLVIVVDDGVLKARVPRPRGISYSCRHLLGCRENAPSRRKGCTWSRKGRSPGCCRPPLWRTGWAGCVRTGGGGGAWVAASAASPRCCRCRPWARSKGSFGRTGSGTWEGGFNPNRCRCGGLGEEAGVVVQVGREVVMLGV